MIRIRPYETWPEYIRRWLREKKLLDQAIERRKP